MIECCYKCGEKIYGKKEFIGITVHKAKCPVCHKVRMLIPLADWEGYGD